MNTKAQRKALCAWVGHDRLGRVVQCRAASIGHARCAEHSGRSQSPRADDGARTRILRFRVSTGESAEIATRAVSWAARHGRVADPERILSEYLRARALGDLANRPQRLLSAVFRVTLDFPNTILDLTNGEESFQAAGDAGARNLQGRLRAGYAGVGVLPRPKDGGAPLNRTGSLIASVAAKVVTKKGPFGQLAVGATIAPRGDRPGELSHRIYKRGKRAGTHRTKTQVEVAAILAQPGAGKDRGRPAYNAWEPDDAMEQAIAEAFSEKSDWRLTDGPDGEELDGSRSK